MCWQGYWALILKYRCTLESLRGSLNDSNAGSHPSILIYLIWTFKTYAYDLASGREISCGTCSIILNIQRVVNQNIRLPNENLMEEQVVHINGSCGKHQRKFLAIASKERRTCFIRWKTTCQWKCSSTCWTITWSNLQRKKFRLLGTWNR